MNRNMRLQAREQWILPERAAGEVMSYGSKRAMPRKTYSQAILIEKIHYRIDCWYTTGVILNSLMTDVFSQILSDF